MQCTKILAVGISLKMAATLVMALFRPSFHASWFDCCVVVGTGMLWNVDAAKRLDSFSMMSGSGQTLTIWVMPRSSRVSRLVFCAGEVFA